MVKTLVVLVIAIGCVLAFPNSKIYLYPDSCKVGGAIAKEGQFPYHISLLSTNYRYCNGAILSEKWVITAADCGTVVSPSNINVVVGRIKLDEDGDRYQVANIIIHPEWDKDQHDIALIKTAKKIVFGEKVGAIPLSKGIVGGGVDVVFSSWGINSYPENELSFINLKTISHSECVIQYPYTIYETQICTVPKKDEDACFCGVGSGLAVNGKLVGITLGKSCMERLPHVFTRISSYVEWIENNAT